MSFLKGFGSVAVAVLLAFGWVWTSFLKDLGLVTDLQRTWILALVTIIFVLQQVYLVMPKPAARAAVAARAPVVENFLRTCLNEYYERHIGAGENRPRVRMNVMLPTKGYILCESLYIYYFACPPGVVYTDKEKDCSWGKHKGTCGWAWAKRQTTIFDSGHQDLSAAALRLTERQREVAGHVQSVLSVPIWAPEKVVGVLNLDSESNVDETHFDKLQVWRLAEATASCLGSLCFRDGVRGS
jgi:GAF domain-containing protein